MKNSAILQSILCLFLSFHALGQETYEQGAYFVYAKSGLSLRAKASEGAKKIATIPYGTKVWALSDSLYGQKATVELEGFSLEGRWKRIEYDTLQGYAFEPYLCPLRPSFEHRNDVEYFQKVIGQVGQTYNLRFDSTGCFEENSDCTVCGYEAAYNYSIIYKRFSCEKNGIEIEIALPGVELGQAYLFSVMLYRLDTYNSKVYPSNNDIAIEYSSVAKCQFSIQRYGMGGSRIVYQCSF